MKVVFLRGFYRSLVFFFIFTLAFPVSGMFAGTAGGQDTDASYVLRRLNSAERKAAIARAVEIDAAAREAFAKEDASANANVGNGNAGNGHTARISQERHPRVGGGPVSSIAAQGEQKALDSRLRGNDVQGGLRGGAGERNWNDGTRDENDGAAGRQTSVRSAASTRPKSITEIMFNAATGLVGLPGLAGDQYDPYDPNVDQGLGFHADGTARRADGTTGSNAASAGYDGKRAASYAGSGLGYSPYGGNAAGLYAGEPGYDPVTGQHYGYSDPVRGGRRNNDHGGQGSGNFDQFDPQQMLFQRGLNHGMGMVNSAAEGLFMGLMESPYGGAKARFNFMLDWDGKVNGEGDLLLPWWDSKYTTVYTQFGARSMSGSSGGSEDGRGADRWIGNFGLGQRWYPLAENEGAGEDAGNLMLGYNAFFDNDFTRSHQRGGVGLEGQYDWLRLASNYYAPLSSWKGSYDFDSDFVQERPAEGWDVRAKGYLPFYRNLALTGAYTQWYGDNVGMFGASNLERDPKVWSYGLEYTPVPLVSGFVNQRSTEKGRSDTEFGLRFTYDFAMPWDEQIRHSKVAEIRTVGGSRHEFVDRENRIILEYKAKNNFHIEYLGKVDTNQFKFRIRNGFDKYVAGQQVRVSAGNGVTLAEVAAPAPTTFMAQAGAFLSGLFSAKAAHAADFSQTYTTDGNGEFLVRLDNVVSAPVVLTIQAGNSAQSITLTDVTPTMGVLSLALDSPQNFPAGVQVNNVSFTLSDSLNAVNVQNKSLSLSFSGNGAFTLPPATVTTDGNGKFALSLTGQTAGTVTLTAALPDGRNAGVPLTVTVSPYTLEALPNTLTQHVPDNVTFTVKHNGVAVPANTSVTFAANANFTGLPTVAQSTNASGQIVLNNLTPTALGTQTISATVDGQTVSVNLTVTTAGYSLEAAPATLAQHVPDNVTFTVKRNGVAVPASTSVTFAANANFTGLPTVAQSTNSSGQIVLNNLTATALGTQTISATVGGQSVSVNLTVTASAGYSLEAVPATLMQHLAQNVTFTVKRNGVAVPVNTSVTFAANANFTGLPTVVQSTNASGQIVLNNLTATASGTQTISATVGGQSVSVSLVVVSSTLYSLTGKGVNGGTSSFSSSTTATVSVELQQNGVAYSGAAQTVTWSIFSANNSANQAVVSSFANKATGLAWGTAATTSAGTELTATTTSATNASGLATIELTDIMGERTVRVRASLIMNNGHTTLTSDQFVTFGKGPLSKFRLPSGGAVGSAQWANAAPISLASSFPAAEMCGGSGNTFWGAGDHSAATKLPTWGQLQTVTGGIGNGAWQAAGWPYGNYGSGVLTGSSTVAYVDSNGTQSTAVVLAPLLVVCPR